MSKGLMAKACALGRDVRVGLSVRVAGVGSLRFATGFGSANLAFACTHLLSSRVIRCRRVVSPGCDGLLESMSVVNCSSRGAGVTRISTAAKGIANISSKEACVSVVASRNATIIRVVIGKVLPCGFSRFVKTRGTGVCRAFKNGPTKRRRSMVICRGVSSRVRCIEFKFDLLANGISSVQLCFGGMSSDCTGHVAECLRGLCAVCRGNAASACGTFVGGRRFSGTSINMA